MVSAPNPVPTRARPWRARFDAWMRWAHAELWVKFLLGFLGLGHMRGMLKPHDGSLRIPRGLPEPQS
jgi:hypothetical protein